MRGVKNLTPFRSMEQTPYLLTDSSLLLSSGLEKGSCLRFYRGWSPGEAGKCML